MLSFYLESVAQRFLVLDHPLSVSALFKATLRKERVKANARDFRGQRKKKKTSAQISRNHTIHLVV